MGLKGERMSDSPREEDGRRRPSDPQTRRPSDNGDKLGEKRPEELDAMLIQLISRAEALRMSRDAQQEAALILLELWDANGTLPDERRLHQVLEAGRARTRRTRGRPIRPPNAVASSNESEPMRLAMLREFKRDIERATRNWAVEYRRFLIDVAVGNESFLVAAKKHIPSIVNRHQARRLWLRLARTLRRALHH